MQRSIWKWIVDADEEIIEVALDLGVSLVVAWVATESLRSIVASL